MLLLFTFGCSDEDEVSVYHTYDHQQEKQVQDKVVVSPEVTIYGVNDSAKGYVIDVEKNKKWIVTVASSVVGHPKVLVETSTGQVVEGEVVTIDEEHNIAMIFMKLTADIKPYHLSMETVGDVNAEQSIGDAVIRDEKKLQGIYSVQKVEEQLTPNFIDSVTIKALLTKSKDEPISYEERLASISYFSDFPKVNVRENNIISKYEKQTFTYNPDELYLFLNNFQKSLNQYYENGDLAIVEPYIASDDLLNNIQHIAENHNGTKQFGQLEFTNSVLSDFLYHVEGKTSLTIDGVEGELKATFKCILMNGEWKLVSVYYSK